jgi:2-succinyl-5-enolpyruvyl-6-hydroxy-3-cyclohexene-1-carboxylate synthase
LPAVIEASLSFTPMIALTADRPFELVDAGAPQTIDQTRLFGGFVRRYVELGLPDDREAVRRAAARAIVQAVAASLGPVPGPVHVNARARKPLEPARFDGATATTEHGRGRTIATPRIAPNPDAIAEVAALCRATPRGLIIGGPTPIAFSSARAAVARLAAATGYPVLAEATSQLRFAPLAGFGAFDTFLGCERFAADPDSAPDVILQLGATPTSSAWERFITRHVGVRRIVLPGHGWPDPHGGALVVSGDLVEALESLSGQTATAGQSAPAWRARFAHAERAAWRTIDEDLAASTALTDGRVARLTVAAAGPGELLVVGNSLPVRLLDGYCPVTPDSDLRVLSQRGTAGIDGLISGAAGAADAWDARTTLLVGDVSFLHDLGGLAVAARSRRLVIVVIHNDGGRIFEQLPLAQVPGVDGEVMRHFTTPHGLDLEPAARLFGAAFARVESAPALVDALAAARQRAGTCSVIEARVPPHAAREQARRIRARLDDRLQRMPERWS